MLEKIGCRQRRGIFVDRNQINNSNGNVAHNLLRGITLIMQIAGEEGWVNWNLALLWVVVAVGLMVRGLNCGVGMF